NAQLATYQVAVEAGGLDGPATPAGARLVYLGTGSTGPTTRQQVPPREAQDPQWAHDLVARVAETMAGAHFEARLNPGCDHCPVRRSCPLQDEGRRVTQGTSSSPPPPGTAPRTSPGHWASTSPPPSSRPSSRPRWHPSSSSPAPG